MPTKPRSIVLDLYGDYLQYTAGEAKLAALVKLLSAFDIESASARMTLSRLKKQGWFETRRDGRETIYTLTDTMMRILTDGRSRIFNRQEEPWDGNWTMVLYQVPESERASREALRKNLAWMGFGQLSSSNWLAAHDRMDEARNLSSEHPDAIIDAFWTRTGSMKKDRDLARRCWDLETLAEDYRQFIKKYQAMSNAKFIKDTKGPRALALRTSLVGDARRFTFRDPQLPLELQPNDWPGREAYELFRHLHSELGPEARTYVESITGAKVNATPPHPGN